MQAEQIRQEAHALIDTMPSYQVAAVVGLLHSMLDPVDRALANAPYDDEPESEAERLEVAEQNRWLAMHPDDTIDHAEILAEFGLSSTAELIPVAAGQRAGIESSHIGEEASPTCPA